MANPAEARVVYTPAHEVIKVNGGLFHIDLNHDGIPDFEFSNSYYKGEKYSIGSLKVASRPVSEQNCMTKAPNCAEGLRLRCLGERGSDLKGSFQNNNPRGGVDGDCHGDR